LKRSAFLKQEEDSKWLAIKPLAPIGALLPRRSATDSNISKVRFSGFSGRPKKPQKGLEKTTFRKANYPPKSDKYWKTGLAHEK
jgi:hypothetical protein